MISMMALKVDGKEEFREMVKSKNVQDLVTSLGRRGSRHHIAVVL